MKTAGSFDLPTTALMFHQHWWLSAASGGRFKQSVVSTGDQIDGHLPYVIDRHRGFTVLRMPPFTHILCPVVGVLSGKPQAQLLRRLSIVKALIDQLPQADIVSFALSAPLADGLAFQSRGFEVMPQFTFDIDCRSDLKTIWANMHSSTRQRIRRAQESHHVCHVEDPNEFVEFYLQNLKRREIRLRSKSEFLTFASLFSACRERGCGEILCIKGAHGKPLAMAFLVCSETTMYYLSTTRSGDEEDNGSVSLLIWSAMQSCHQRGLIFDLDGVTSSGTARFLSRFGGEIKSRVIVRRRRPLYRLVQDAKRLMSPSDAEDLSNFA